MSFDALTLVGILVGILCIGFLVASEVRNDATRRPSHRTTGPKDQARIDSPA